MVLPVVRATLSTFSTRQTGPSPTTQPHYSGTRFRALAGQNGAHWTGVLFDRDVIAGDDTSGQLWRLDPAC